MAGDVRRESIPGSDVVSEKQTVEGVCDLGGDCAEIGAERSVSRTDWKEMAEKSKTFKNKANAQWDAGGTQATNAAGRRSLASL